MAWFATRPGLIVAALLTAATPSHGGDEPIGRLRCQGSEPFWSLDVDGDSARFMRPSGTETDTLTFSGALEPVDRLAPPWLLWRGTTDGDPPSTLLAVFRQETCLGARGSTDHPYDHRVLLSVPDTPPLTGCCRAMAAINLHAAPVADPAAKPADDWSRNMDELMPAIRTCVADGPVKVDRVLEAWPMPEGVVGVRVMTSDRRRHDCIASPRNGRLDRASPVEADAEKRPGEGDPAFYPVREPPPSLSAGRVERVEDQEGALLGWLHYAGDGEAETPPASLAGKTFRLEMRGRGVDVSDFPPTLAFGVDGVVAGDTGCNRFSGRYMASADGIGIGPLVSTKRGCVAPIMAQERRLLDALERASKWRVEAGRLVLSDSAGRELARFVLAE